MSPVPIVLKAIPVETICVCLCARLTRSVHSMRNVLKETACVSNHISAILYLTYFICKHLTCWMSKNCLQLNLFLPPVFHVYQSHLHEKVWSWECVSHIQVSHEFRSLLRESVPYVKIYRYSPKHLCPKLNGYGDNGKRKVWTSWGCTHVSWP